jgi:oxaloacetate decarboxylase gamma subunit
MQDTQLWWEGLSLMAFGMGFVFVFLTLLVGATTVMSRLALKIAPVPTREATPDRRADTAPAAEGDVMAAIAVAVHRYRRRHRR